MAETAEKPSNTPGYETRDLSFRSMALFGIALIAVLVVAGLGLALLYMALSTSQAKSGEIPSMVTPQLPPAPRLEVVPGGSLENLQATDQKQLTTYGWVDRQHGIVHIPIDQAMQLLIKRGLPMQPPASSAQLEF